MEGAVDTRDSPPKSPNLRDSSNDTANAVVEVKLRPKTEIDVRARSRTTSQIRSYKTLCGYLSKYATKGLIRTAKKRWFVFCENNCKLYYYRSSTAADNQMPLGEIDISNATFFFEANNKERPGIFTISTPDKDFILEAKDREASLFWLQELRRWRQQYSRNRTLQIRKSPLTDKSLQEIPNSGLYGHAIAERSDVTENCTDTFLLDPIERPRGVIGEESIEEASAQRILAQAQQRMLQFGSQMMSSVSHIKNSGRTSVADYPVAYSSKDSSVTTGIRHHESHASCPASKETVTNLSKLKSPSLNTLKKKVQQSFRVKRTSSEAEKFPSNNRRRSRSIEPACNHCRELQVRIVSLKDDLTAIEDELCAGKEALQILQKQLEITSVERDTLMKVCQLTVPKAHLDLLREKETTVLGLRYEIVDLKEKLQAQREAIDKLEGALESGAEEVSLYKELMQQKDKMVVSLTNDLFDLEAEKKLRDAGATPPPPPLEEVTRSNSFKSYLQVDSPTSSSQPEDIENLKDALEAFELQNKFLNKEILELNQLRRDGEDRERSLMLSRSEWEARCYQIQSKLLFLLKELEKSDLESNGSTRNVVSRLLEEAMEESSSSEPLFTPSWGRDKDYDELGFNWKWGKEEDLLSTKATNLKQKSEGITSRMKDPEVTLWMNKWENFVVNLGNRELPIGLELKQLLRNGVPRQFRGSIWKGCVDMRIRNLRKRKGENYYENILSSSSDISRFDPAVKQIELDLLRTLPNNRHYETLDSYGIPQLRRVLLAYSRHNPSVGYCQGLNRLAAIALLYMDEEDAFWLLVSIVEFIMPQDYYSKTLKASQVDQRVLKDLLSEKLPRLNSHLERNNVDLSLYTFTWFLTIFVDNIPPETYMRIWDVFLYEGSKVLFRYALAFFKMCEAELLALSDYMCINNHLRSLSANMTDIKRLSQIAFNELNPFPMKMIAAKRAHHTQLVQGQLDELEKIRKSSTVNPKGSKDDFYFSDDD